MSKPAIVAFGGTAWNSEWMNRQHLLSRLAARGYPIAYSNGIAHYTEYSSLPFWPRLEWQDQVLLARRGYFPPASVRLTWPKRLALRMHCRAVLKALGEPRSERVIGMCFDPKLLDCVDVLAPGRRIFHIYDSYHKMHGHVGDFEQVRRRIIAYDLVTASSAQMYEEVTGRVPRPECIVANGVDFSCFDTANLAPSPTADTIRALPGARIGYIGSINTKIDFALINWLSERFSDDSFVLVGPTRYAVLERESGALAAYKQLLTRPNVHIFPAVSRHEIPAILAAMHINCIFFRVDRADWVPAVYPIKLNEYLASGKPVISCDLRVVRENFSEVVTTCVTREQWADAIEHWRRENGDGQAVAARRAVACANDWERRVDQLETLIANIDPRVAAGVPA